MCLFARKEEIIMTKELFIRANNDRQTVVLIFYFSSDDLKAAATILKKSRCVCLI